jgi:hypothetical protein
MLPGAASLVLALAAPAAHAGALAEVAKGLHQAAGDDGRSGNRAGPANEDNDHVTSSGSSSSSSSDSGSGGGSWSCCSIDPDVSLGYAYATTAQPGQVLTELYFGAQSVHDSDGALTAEARATFDDFGLGVRGTSFYERESAGLDPQFVHLDIWWLGGFWRVDHDDRFSVWLELGFTGLSDQTGLTMSGASAGVHLWRQLAGAFSFVGGARTSLFQHDVHANELFAGVQVTFLQFSYRVLDFDVGPPLYGPEVGLAVAF